MVYYIDPENKLHFLNDVDVANSGEALLPEGSVQITDEAAAAMQAAANMPTLTEQVQAVEDGIQQWLDKAAQAKGYDTLASCISYLNSSNPTWQADAHAGNAWRDAVWIAAFAANAEVQAGTRPVPELAAALAALPQPADFGFHP